MRRVVQVGLVVALVLDTAYWAIWFTDRDMLASSHRQAYDEFERRDELLSGRP